MSASTWSPPLPNGWDYTPPQASKAPALPPAPALAVRAYRVLGDSDTQARRKVEMIRRLVVQPALSPTGLPATRKLLAEILGGEPKKAVNGYEQSRTAVRIFEWVKSRIRYVKDPQGKELFQQIPALLAGGIGDCDDYTAILAVLFSAAGLKPYARIIKLRRNGPWAHIYPVVELEGKRRAFDGALPQALDHRAGKPGFEYPNPAQRLDLEVV